MTREQEHALFLSVIYLLQARTFDTEGEARNEAQGYLESLQDAFYRAKPTAPSQEERAARWERIERAAVAIHGATVAGLTQAQVVFSYATAASDSVTAAEALVEEWERRQAEGGR